MLFTKQFEKIRDDSIIRNGRINNIIDSMCKYEKLSDINNREDIIIENVLKKCEEKEIHYFMELPFFGCKRFLSFTKKLKTAYESKQISEMVNNLNNLHCNGKYSELYDLLCEIERRALFVVDNNLNNDILNCITSNNFFIENLFGTIETSRWDVAHKICEVAVRYDFAEDVATYIKSIDYQDDSSAKERYDFLLTNKLNCDNQ